MTGQQKSVIMKKPGKPEAGLLRRKAEEKLGAPASPGLRKSGALSESEALKLLHELEVHHVELEIQNQELRMAREQADSAAAKYADLYDFAPASYLTLSREGRVIEINLTGARMLCKERVRLRNNLFVLFVSAPSQPVFRLFMANVFKGLEGQSCELTLSLNGNRPVQVYLTATLSENGEQCYLTAVDISARKEAESALAEMAERYRELMERARDAIFSLSPNGLVTSMSPAFETISGWPVHEWMGKPFTGLLHPEDAALASQRFMNVMTGITSDAFRLRIQKKQGGVVYTEIIASPQFKNGNPVGILGIGRDITERVIAEGELVLARKQAEESDRLKSAFLANMSHEIRTPMNGILGFAELLKEPGLALDDQKQYISMIQKGGARLLNIINNLISISKVEAGMMEVHLAEISVNGQLEFLFQFFRPEADVKGIRLSYSNGLPESEAVIRTDPEKFLGIMTNLIMNAIKFTNNGAIEFGYKAKGDCLEFLVSDQGVGIAAEQLEFIFDRFRQGSESLTRNYQGSGLGLSISKAYVEMLGGTIRVESKPGEGTTFYFTIPWQGKPAHEDRVITILHPDKKDDPVKKLKILVVEDDESSSLFISLIIKDISRELLYASSGVESISTCRSHSDIDLVLMDIRVPEMDGYEATRKIREFNREVVIIAQTAFALAGDRERALEAGCNEYCTKPVDRTLLMDMISKHFPVEK
jgi:PAS domain S-box-containing protein